MKHDFKLLYETLKDGDPKFDKKVRNAGFWIVVMIILLAFALF